MSLTEAVAAMGLSTADPARPRTQTTRFALRLSMMKKEPAGRRDSILQ